MKLMGGLGNQMFSYALGRRLANGLNTELQLDTSQLENPHPGDTPRHYELDHFAFSPTFADAKILPQPTSRLGGLARRLGMSHDSALRTVVEHGIPFDPKILETPDNSYLIGYWQTEKYFNDVRDLLLQDFSFKTAPNKANRDMAASIAKVTAVSLHVRRGDYVTNANANQFHGLAPLDYYNAAVKLMREKVKNPHFFVFSDDPKWTQENIKIGQPTTYVTHNDANTGHEDMRLMMQCRHHIVANSSFSWWGAWLNPRSDKIVIAPQRWFIDPSVDGRDIYAEGWLKL